MIYLHGHVAPWTPVLMVPKSLERKGVLLWNMRRGSDLYNTIFVDYLGAVLK